MRHPTPLHETLAWWRSALAGEKPQIHDSTPMCGFYKRRFVKGGPYVPVKIWLVSPTDPETGELTADEYVCCTVNGRDADAADQWSYCADSPITESDFDLMTRRAAWAGAHASDHPAATPNRAVDWQSARIPF